ncbi:ABC transporter substrate-binding protein [Actinoplanes sp. NPDC051859]|uniref:ABC transporter substrate-binding protein n=1 Tax=Actinoplanes sp. NPDC051859 TaxID=3363909 RepID=UPI003792DFCA
MKMSPLRLLAMSAAALVASVSLVGCGSSGSVSPATPSSGLLPAAEGKTAYPLTLKAPWGESVLGKRPERVAVVGYTNDAENTMVLGVTPVWADKEQTGYPWVPAAQAKKIERLGELGDTFPFEDIAAARPDLIIAIQTDPGQLRDSYQRLSSIAPVLTTEAPSFDLPWESVVRTIGSTLDLADRANQVVTGVQKKISDTAKAHPEYKGKSVTFLLLVPGRGFWTYRSFAGSANATIMQNLGFTLPAAASKFTRDNLIISAENYGLLDADVLLIAAPKKELESILQVPTFADLPVVVEKRYELLDLDTEANIGVAISWPTALNVPWFIDRIQPALTAAATK